MLIQETHFPRPLYVYSFKHSEFDILTENDCSIQVHLTILSYLLNSVAFHVTLENEPIDMNEPIAFCIATKRNELDMNENAKTKRLTNTNSTVIR